MRDLLFLLFLVVGASLPAQYTADCNPQPEVYGMQQYTTQNYVPDLDECLVQFVGPLYQVEPLQGRMYTTLQVMAGQTFHGLLPLNFGVGYNNGLNIYVMNPYYYEMVGHEAATQRAAEAGFPCPKTITIEGTTEFPNWNFN